MRRNRPPISAVTHQIRFIGPWSYDKYYDLYLEAVDPLRHTDPICRLINEEGIFSGPHEREYLEEPLQCCICLEFKDRSELRALKTIRDTSKRILMALAKDFEGAEKRLDKLFPIRPPLEGMTTFCCLVHLPDKPPIDLIEKTNFDCKEVRAQRLIYPCVLCGTMNSLYTSSKLFISQKEKWDKLMNANGKLIEAFGESDYVSVCRSHLPNPQDLPIKTKLRYRCAVCGDQFDFRSLCTIVDVVKAECIQEYFGMGEVLTDRLKNEVKNVWVCKEHRDEVKVHPDYEAKYFKKFRKLPKPVEIKPYHRMLCRKTVNCVYCNVEELEGTDKFLILRSHCRAQLIDDFLGIAPKLANIVLRSEPDDYIYVCKSHVPESILNCLMLPLRCFHCGMQKVRSMMLLDSNNKEKCAAVDTFLNQYNYIIRASEAGRPKLAVCQGHIPDTVVKVEEEEIRPCALCNVPCILSLMWNVSSERDMKIMMKMHRLKKPLEKDMNDACMVCLAHVPTTVVRPDYQVDCVICKATKKREACIRIDHNTLATRYATTLKHNRSIGDVVTRKKEVYFCRFHVEIKLHRKIRPEEYVAPEEIQPVLPVPIPSPTVTTVCSVRGDIVGENLFHSLNMRKQSSSGEQGESEKEPVLIKEEMELLDEENYMEKEDEMPMNMPELGMNGDNCHLNKEEEMKEDKLPIPLEEVERLRMKITEVYNEMVAETLLIEVFEYHPESSDEFYSTLNDVITGFAEFFDAAIAGGVPTRESAIRIALSTRMGGRARKAAGRKKISEKLETVINTEKPPEKPALFANIEKPFLTGITAQQMGPVPDPVFLPGGLQLAPSGILIREVDGGPPPLSPVGKGDDLRTVLRNTFGEMEGAGSSSHPMDTVDDSPLLGGLQSPLDKAVGLQITPVHLAQHRPQFSGLEELSKSILTNSAMKGKKDTRKEPANRRRKCIVEETVEELHEETTKRKVSIGGEKVGKPSTTDGLLSDIPELTQIRLPMATVSGPGEEKKGKMSGLPEIPASLRIPSPSSDGQPLSWKDPKDPSVEYRVTYVKCQVTDPKTGELRPGMKRIISKRKMVVRKSVRNGESGDGSSSTPIRVAEEGIPLHMKQEIVEEDGGEERQSTVVGKGNFNRSLPTICDIDDSVSQVMGVQKISKPSLSMKNPLSSRPKTRYIAPPKNSCNYCGKGAYVKDCVRLEANERGQLQGQDLVCAQAAGIVDIVHEYFKDEYNFSFLLCREHISKQSGNAYDVGNDGASSLSTSLDDLFSANSDNQMVPPKTEMD